jgi:hypothetical protein
MAFTIDRPQRDAIYRQVATDLSGLGDIIGLLLGGDIDGALRHRRWFEGDMRLLDDLGWEREAPGERFELTMAPADLARLLGRLNDDAGAMLNDHLSETADERDHAQQLLVARTAYGHALAHLASDTLTDAPAGERDEPGSSVCRAGGSGESTGPER